MQARRYSIRLCVSALLMIVSICTGVDVLFTIIESRGEVPLSMAGVLFINLVLITIFVGATEYYLKRWVINHLS